MAMPAGDKDYTIAWANTAAVPRGMRLTLVDQSTGTRRAMNTTSSYTFHAGTNETTRAFQVIAEPHASSLIQIMNLRAITAPGATGRAAGVTISFETTTDAEATIEIQYQGRPIRGSRAGPRRLRRRQPVRLGRPGRPGTRPARRRLYRQRDGAHAGRRSDAPGRADPALSVAWLVARGS